MHNNCARSVVLLIAGNASFDVCAYAFDVRARAYAAHVRPLCVTHSAGYIINEQHRTQ